MVGEHQTLQPTGMIADEGETGGRLFGLMKLCLRLRRLEGSG